MNRERVRCDCGSLVIRISAHDHETKIPIGTYCPGCKRLRDTQGRDLRPVVPLKSRSEIGQILQGQFYAGLKK